MAPATSRELLVFLRSILTLRQRRVCAALWYDNLTAADIGTRFGMSAKAVYQIVFRARAALRAAGVSLPRNMQHRTTGEIETVNAPDMIGEAVAAQAPDVLDLVSEYEE